MAALALLALTVAVGAGAGQASDVSSCVPLRQPRTVEIGLDRIVRGIHFRVQKLVFRGCSWRAEARLRNTARVPVWITPGFALLITDSTKSRQNALPRLDATFFSRQVPRRLRPRESWSGMLGGWGLPRGRAHVSMSLGLFISKHLCRGCIGFGVESREFAWPR